MNGFLQRSFLCSFLGLIFALFITAMCGLPQNGWCCLAVILGLAVVFGGGLHVVAHHYDDKLNRRIAQATSQRWVVVLNDVKLGTVSDAEYAAMQQRVLRDGRVAGEQFLNLCHVALRIVSRLFVLVPFVLFWTAVVFYLTSPDTVASVILAAQKADVTMIASAARMLFQWVSVFASSALVVMAASGLDIGVRDCYSIAVHRELRRHFKTPALGEMRLTQEPGDCGCTSG
jgi:hypothetical protein